MVTNLTVRARRVILAAIITLALLFSNPFATASNSGFGPDTGSNSTFHITADGGNGSNPPGQGG